MYTKNWVVQNSLPNKALMSFCVCKFMGKIYIMGGYDSDKPGDCTQKTALTYDPKTDAWEEKATMNESRRHAACSVFDGKTVVSGGIDLQESRSVEVYDAFSDEWSDMPDMLERRSHHSQVSIRKNLYIIGGYYTQQCEIYDGFNQLFVRIFPDMPLFGERHSRIQCLTIGSRIIIFKSTGLEGVAVFHVDKGEWSEVKQNMSAIKPNAICCVKTPKL